MRAAAAIVIACVTACYETPAHQGTSNDDMTGGSGSGTSAGPTTTVGEGSTMSTTAGDPDSGPMDTSGSTAPGTSGSATEDSTGGPIETCGNGDHEPGELCFGELELVDFDSGAIDVAIGILDGDAILDLAVASGGTAGVRVGDGVGGFGNLEAFDPMGDTVAIAAADFDHDDYGDAIALAQPVATIASWQYGWDLYQYDGNGQALDPYNDLVIGSFDNTYELDVVYTTASQVILQSGSKPNYTYLLGAPVSVVPNGNGAAGIATTTFVFDGDSDADLVVVHRDTNTADVVRGNGSGGFAVHGSFAVCPEGAVGARRVAIGDVDGDGFQDLVTTCAGDRVAVTVGNDDGTFAPPVAYDVVDGFGVVVTDLDGAGEIDVAVASPSSGVITVFANEGGALVARVELVVGEPIGGLDSADLDGDGSRDLAVAVPSGAVALFRSDP